MPAMKPGPGGLLRHVAACNNAALPGGRHPLRLQGTILGWVSPDLSRLLPGFGVHPSADGGIDLSGAATLETLARDLADAGQFRPRGEAFDIVASPGGVSLGRIDRGAMPVFGLLASGVHLNGLVEQPDGPWLWVGRRAANKALDPNKLDHLVAGGVSAGLSVEQTLAKEGEEECSLPADWCRRAARVAEITYSMQRPEGLRRDLLHVFDLVLPPEWVPVPNDGEVVEFQLLPLKTVLETVRDTDAFKFNVNLVLIDLFLRRGLVDASSSDGRRLRAGLHGAL